MSTNAYSPETDEDGGDFIVNSSEDEEEEEPRTTLVPSGQVITFEVKTMTGGSMRFSAARATTGKELKAAIEVYLPEITDCTSTFCDSMQLVARVRGTGSMFVSFTVYVQTHIRIHTLFPSG